ncbi:MAG: NADH-quinone oxidoreductase subunit L [Epsilonproteobacteria bacterium]|nr:NADH-quinone oxidoreductase subunit L [Campylobacterota bacterium]
MEKYIYITLFAPLIGSLVSAIFGAKEKKLFVGIFASIMLLVSAFSAIYLLFHIDAEHIYHVKLMDWISAGNLHLSFGFVADQVSVIMMVTVTFVSAMIHIYSIGYMEHDQSFNRFFVYLSLFVFSMLILVMSDNFVGLFIGWEGVGLCSWLLIGFWYHKDSASWAANEAFIMNRVADLGMLIGLFLIYWNTGSLQYDEVFAKVGSLSPSTLTLIGIFLFIGAMGKSAQFPFHTWLADAMEGPTPVSALIHAATMVTAGVFLVIRANQVFSMIPDVGLFIASLGAFVAVFAASMALVNNDLKKIIAYSTLSQLGYMFVAAGLGAYWIALFHLMTHAFFKSVLFLGAGNVMHAMDDELNIKKMGGLGDKMKWTMIIMTVASLALAGIYPFAGFFSKDKILEVAFAQDHYVLWAMLWIGAGMTAFYSFRLVMLVFFGEERYKHYGFHPHEVKAFVLWAMAPLAVFATIGGFFEHPFMEFTTELLPKYEPEIEPHFLSYVLVVLTLGLAISGILYAVYKYSTGGFSKEVENYPIYKLLSNQYYIPEFYNKCIVKPYMVISSFLWQKIDVAVVDKTVDTIAKGLYSGGDKARGMQSGNLSNMLRLMVFGLLVLLLLVVIFNPAS